MRNTQLVKFDEESKYHVVCPSNTYWVNKRCYNDLFNRIDLIVLPKWDNDTKDLNWEFSLITSSYLSESLVNKLKPTWLAPSNFVLTKGLNDYEKEASTEHTRTRLIPYKYFRNEAHY